MGTIVAGNPVLSAGKELNVLTWCNHTDPALLRPFEEKHNVRINMKEYDGTGVALAFLEQSQPGIGMFLWWTASMSGGWLSSACWNPWILRILPEIRSRQKQFGTPSETWQAKNK